jgi:hypothetical protein
MMPNGKILCAFAPPIYCCDPIMGGNVYPGPISFYEYDFSSGPVGSFARVSDPPVPNGSFDAPYGTMMLVLPDGNVLYSHTHGGIFVYQPDGTPLAVGKPAINSITPNADGSYHLTGTRLNGISQGAAYGDDAQMDSNYPLVRLTDLFGNVHFARTYNWSSTSVITGNRVVSTEFSVPVGTLPRGTYSLVVVANGIASDPWSIDLPSTQDFYVNGNYFGPSDGSEPFPFRTVTTAYNQSRSGRLNILHIRGAHTSFNGHYNEQLTLAKPMRLLKDPGSDGDLVIGKP